MSVDRKIFATPALVAEAFVHDFLLPIDENVKGPVHIALSGGSTPAILFDLLASSFSDKINWKSIHFWWGDERCVPPDHAESNYLMTRQKLLDRIDIPATNIHRIWGEANPEKEAIRYGAEINTHMPTQNAWPVFDVIILGMGDDGHTASIFPHQMELLDSDSICAVADHPVSGQKRVSLTGKVIRNAKQIVFLVTGSKKTEKVAEILNRKEGSGAYPASHISSTHGKLYWYVDNAAAAGL